MVIAVVVIVAETEWSFIIKFWKVVSIVLCNKIYLIVLIAVKCVINEVLDIFLMES